MSQFKSCPRNQVDKELALTGAPLSLERGTDPNVDGENSRRSLRCSSKAIEPAAAALRPRPLSPLYPPAILYSRCAQIGPKCSGPNEDFDLAALDTLIKLRVAADHDSGCERNSPQAAQSNNTDIDPASARKHHSDLRIAKPVHAGKQAGQQCTVFI